MWDKIKNKNTLYENVFSFKGLSVPTEVPDEDDDDWDEDEESSEADDDGRIYKNPRNSPSTECPRDEEQATLLGQKCLRKCSSDEDCKSKKKKCLCDGACGMSCIKPGLFDIKRNLEFLNFNRNYRSRMSWIGTTIVGTSGVIWSTFWRTCYIYMSTWISCSWARYAKFHIQDMNYCMRSLRRNSDILLSHLLHEVILNMLKSLQQIPYLMRL